MDIIHHHSQRDLVKINPQKSDLICYNSKSERKVDIGSSELNKSENAKHHITANIEERIKLGREIIYGLF